MGQSAGVSGIAAQTDRLAGGDMITNVNEGAALGEVAVMGEGAVRMANLDPVGLAFSMLAVAKLHAYVGHHAGACCSHGRADGHDEVIGILEGTLVSAI